MGLLDVLRGMQNGPRGERQPQASSSGGMSPMMMALLGLLAYKAVSGGLGNMLGGRTNTSDSGNRPAPTPSGDAAPAGEGTQGGLGGLLGGLLGGAGTGSRPGGSLGDMIPGRLGGLLGGAASGSVLSGGLGNLLKDLENSGHGDKAQSWVSTGENKQIAPNELESAVGADTIDALGRQTGMNRDDLLRGLSQHLPEFVDRLTPQGRVPTEEEAASMG